MRPPRISHAPPHPMHPPCALRSVCWFGADELYDALERQVELVTTRAQPVATFSSSASPLAATPQLVSSSAPIQEHNEVVVDSASLVAALPDGVQAVFFSAASTAADIKFARAVHARLLEEYGMRPGKPGTPPLLLLDLLGAGDSPFSLPGPAWLEE